MEVYVIKIVAESAQVSSPNNQSIKILKTGGMLSISRDIHKAIQKVETVLQNLQGK
jgi:hypothetical protein